MHGSDLPPCIGRAAIAQLGERQTEDLKVPGSIPGLGIFSFSNAVINLIAFGSYVVCYAVHSLANDTCGI